MMPVTTSSLSVENRRVIDRATEILQSEIIRVLTAGERNVRCVTLRVTFKSERLSKVFVETDKEHEIM
jgi:hypothetical protein